MKTLVYEKTETTPKIVLDPENGIYEFTGRSIPDNAKKFYDPILNWFNDQLIIQKRETNIVFKFDYFDTTSSKCILDILKKIKKVHNNKENIFVLWYYQKDDECMQEAGEEYAEILGPIIKTVQY